VAVGIKKKKSKRKEILKRKRKAVDKKLEHRESRHLQLVSLNGYLELPFYALRKAEFFQH
jgi:hypothetical protein